MNLRVLFAHIGLRFTQLLKEPGYVVSTMVFPALFFLIFAQPNADTEAKARFLLASFTVFAVLGVCFFQFGVHQAQEIRTGWYAFLHTLPVGRTQLLIAQWVSALVCAALASAAVLLAVAVSTDLDIGISHWTRLVMVIMIGAIPFALFSVALAHVVSAWAALPAFNLIYILSSFAGGLWLPPNALPAKIEALSQYIPTRHLGEIAWKLALNEPVEAAYVLRLAGFSVVTLIAVVVVQRSRRSFEKI